MASMKDLLSHVPLYVGLQKAVGADKLRYWCLDAARIQPGEVVIDVGCGPAYYFERLPQPLTYHGFDTDQKYIEQARSKLGDRGTFHHGVFDGKAAADLPAPDVVLLLGLLHHLSDPDSRDLLELCASILTPRGRVVSVDTAFVPGQGRLSRWMSHNDRGEFVRDPEGFEALAAPYFGSTKTQIVSGTGRIPGAYVLMTLSESRASVEDVTDTTESLGQ
jgi:SAM-dependent methyltransferase